MRTSMMRRLQLALCALVLAGAAGACRAQEVNIGVQTGLGYLPLQVMVHEKLLESHAKALGLNDVRAKLVSFANGAAMNDALLSGGIQYGAGGVSTFLTLWSKTKGSNEVRSAGALLSMPMYLNTRAPHIKSVRDFGPNDRIGVAGVKLSYQAILLQMAAAKEYGDKEYARFDPLTVTMSNPDGLIALSNPRSEVNTHFASPPYAYQEQKMPGVHTVLKSYDILGGPATLNVVWCSTKFATAHPKLQQAFVAALKESMGRINADKQAAARIYIATSGDKTPVDQIVSQLENPDIQYDIVPHRVTVIADFMKRIGTLKKPYTSWRDFYFPELHDLAGNEQP
jgi:NitT/TauT family transport system substrate-binding protein